MLSVCERPPEVEAMRSVTGGPFEPTILQVLHIYHQPRIALSNLLTDRAARSLSSKSSLLKLDILLSGLKPAIVLCPRTTDLVTLSAQGRPRGYNQLSDLPLWYTNFRVRKSRSGQKVQFHLLSQTPQVFVSISVKRPEARLSCLAVEDLR